MIHQMVLIVMLIPYRSFFAGGIIVRETIIAKELGDMVRIKTYSPKTEEDLKPFYELHEVMRKACPKVFSELESYETNGNLLFRVKGKKEGHAMLLMGHQDVVPADNDGWRHPPFEAEIDNGVMYGRGTVDCKSVIYSEFKAVEELLQEGFEPEYDLYLATAVDEEIGGNGAPSLVEELRRRGVRLELVLDEGGNIKMNPFEGERKRWGLMGILEKGAVNVRITAYSKGGHAGMPPRNNPIARLAAFVNEVETVRPFKVELEPAMRATVERIAPYITGELGEAMRKLDEYNGDYSAFFDLTPFAEPLLATTCVFTVMQGSKVPNMIPNEAYVVANIRTMPHQGCEESFNIIKSIAEKYDLVAEIEGKTREATEPYDINTDAFRFVEQCIREVFPDVEPVPYPVFGGTDCRHYVEITDVPIRFCPIYLDPTQTNHAHKANEKVSLKNVDLGIDFYKYMIKKWQMR